MTTSFKTIKLLLSLLFAANAAIAQEWISKTTEKSFPLSRLHELQLDNRYGDITVTGWDKKEVSVKISIQVTTGENKISKEVLQRIDPVFKSDENIVSVISRISKSELSWFKSIFKSGDRDNSQIQIDYMVYAAREAKLKIINRFGNVVLNQWEGPLNSFVEHGDIQINDNLAKADISIEFGKLEAKEIQLANLNLKNAALIMDGSNALKISSRGTNMKIGTVNTLDMDSNKDIIELKEVSTIFGYSKFGSLKIKSLTHSLNLGMKIVDLTVQKISGEGTQLLIEQESSKIFLGITDFSHRFSATLEQGVVRIPKAFENVHSNIMNKAKKLREIEGTYGITKSGKIDIIGSKGIITLKE